MAEYTATVTLARQHPGADLADEVHDSDLDAFAAVTSTDDTGRARITISLEAATLHQAGIIAHRLLSRFTDAVRLDVMTSDEHFADDTPEPSPMLSVTEAAARLGITRQSVLGRIQRGTLDAQRVGTVWMVPETSLAS